jgi:hypothetical protein
LVSKEVRKRLDDLLREEKRMGSIYDPFGEIGEHMIQRVKSFTVAKLSQDDIDHVLVKFAE